MTTMWDAALYLRFGGERARPFFDLLARVGAELPRYVVDMGCGPGNLTVLLAERWPTAVVSGVDSSPEMISEARKLATSGAPRSPAPPGHPRRPRVRHGWRGATRLDCRSCSTTYGTGNRRACPM